MKISDLITQLEEIKKADGDLEVEVQKVIKSFPIKLVASIIENGKIKVIIK